MRMRRWIGLLAVTVALMGGCSSKSSASQPATSVAPAPGSSVVSPAPPSDGGQSASGLAGTWKGTWTSTSDAGANGTFKIDWQQQGSKLDGTIEISDTPCLTGGTITGTLKGTTIDFGVVSGSYQVDYKGSLSGDTMAGTYSTDCGNGKGTWEASKSA